MEKKISILRFLFKCHRFYSIWLDGSGKDIDKFYLDTQQKIKSKDKNGVISNMSQHSQAGPGVAYTASKYGLKENRTIKVTNFMDFAAKKAVDTGGISKGTGSLS